MRGGHPPREGRGRKGKASITPKPIVPARSQPKRAAATKKVAEPPKEGTPVASKTSDDEPANVSADSTALEQVC